MTICLRRVPAFLALGFAFVSLLGARAGAQATSPPSVQFGAASETAAASLETFSIPVTLSAVTTPHITPFASGFSSPHGLAFDSAGNLYVANSAGGGSISKVTPDGVVSTFATGFAGVTALAFDAAGNLYTANSSDNTVSKVTPAGAISTFVSGLSAPFGLAFDAAGNLYISNHGASTVSAVTPAGVVSTFVSGTVSPSGLAFDRAGNLFVASDRNESVYKVTPAGVVSSFYFQLDSPAALAFDSGGNLYAANYGGSSLSVISPSGTVSSFSAGVSTPFGLAFDSKGDLYLSSVGLNTVSRLSGTSVSVPFTLGGTAAAGVDYTGVTVSPLMIPANQTTATITGTLVLNPGADQTLTFTLGAPTGASLGSPAVNTLTITEQPLSPPTVTGFYPNTGSTDGGTSVTINGTNFAGTPTVTLGGVAATNVTIVSATSLTATTGPHAAGAVDVAVTTTGGAATGTGLYTYKVPLLPGAAVVAWDDFLSPTNSGGGWSNNWTASNGVTANLSYAGLHSGGDAVNNRAIPAGSNGGPGRSFRTLRGPQTTGILYLSALVTGGGLCNIALYSDTMEKIDFGVVDHGGNPGASFAANDHTGATRLTESSVPVDAATHLILVRLDLDANRADFYVDADLSAPLGTPAFTTTAGSGSDYHFNRLRLEVTGTATLDEVRLMAADPVLIGDQVTSPAISDATAAAITQTGATLGGNVTSDGGTAIKERGIVFAPTATNPNPTVYDSTKVTVAGMTGIFTTPVTGLSAGTQYSFRAFATNSIGTTYTNVAGFTAGGTQVTSPAISGPNIGSITGNGATLGGNVTSDGGTAITERGFVYALASTNAYPTIDSDGVSKVTVAGTTGVFTVHVYGLSAGTQYSVRAFATNSLGTTSTDAATFLTTPPFAGAYDAVTTGTGETRIYPLANDDSPSGTPLSLVSVSNPAIKIDGRSLIIPAGYTGTFTYQFTGGTTLSEELVRVTGGAAAVNARAFNGLLRDRTGAITGSADAAFTAGGRAATVQLRVGTSAVGTVVLLPAGSLTGTRETALGTVTLTRQANGSVECQLASSTVQEVFDGVLLPRHAPGAAAMYHVALASVDPAVLGGGYAFVRLLSAGTVLVIARLPDGQTFVAGTALRDNGTIAFYTVIRAGVSPPEVVGGELVSADLTTTDLTGEWAWSKPPQHAGVRGLHLGGVDTLLTANGCLFQGAPLAGAGHLELAGGNLASTEDITVTAGRPTTPTGSLKAWAIDTKRGIFLARVKVPGLAVPVPGAGLYLPKSHRAWGFFPGATEGGRIELTIPPVP